jgi:hypothetical protein
MSATRNPLNKALRKSFVFIGVLPEWSGLQVNERSGVEARWTKLHVAAGSKERLVLEQGSTCLLNIGFVRPDDTRYVGKVPSSPVFFLRYVTLVSSLSLTLYIIKLMWLRPSADFLVA